MAGIAINREELLEMLAYGLCLGMVGHMRLYQLQKPAGPGPAV